MENITESAAWTAHCLAPLTESVCGVNPLYHDDFETVKLEIEKLSGCNYAFILEQCSKLLTEMTKDLRVAGFLCLALTWKHQIEGLITGLNLYKNLLDLYSKDIHPSSDKARRSALKWLNNPKFSALLGTTEQNSQESIQQLSQAISSLNETIQTQLGDDFQRFNILDEYLTTIKLIQPQSDEPEKTKEKPKPLAIKASNQPEDEQQALDLQRQLINYWQQEKQWLMACQLARSLRWTHLSIPQNPLPPPRKEALQSLDKAIQQAHPESILSQCESLFLEPGGHYLLDFQYHAHQAAKSLGQLDLADYILQQTTWLTHRHPQLKTLQFANGLAFVSNETRHWLEKASKENQNLQEKSVEDYLKLANIQDKSSDLMMTLKQLHDQNPQLPLEELRLLQAKARACQYGQRHDLAMIYYQELLEIMDRQNFALWHKDEALSIWQEIMLFTESKGHLSLSADQSKQLVFQIKRNICLGGQPANN